MEETDKSHWFLCGLGPSYETFSTAQRAVKPRPFFRDLLSQAKGHELFLKSIHGSTAPPVTFTAQPSRSPASSNSGSYHSGQGGHGRGRRPPHFQLCRKDGHYATQCPYLTKDPPLMLIPPKPFMPSVTPITLL